MYQKLILIGNVGKKPELRMTGGKEAVQLIAETRVLSTMSEPTQNFDPTPAERRVEERMR